MDLIYANAKREDIGVMRDFSFDLAYGEDENNFALLTNTQNNVCGEGYILYIEGTEYGGIVDRLQVDTSVKGLTYSGRTWHGVLQNKVLEPDAGEDYLVCNGEANSVLAVLVARMNLGDLFTADTEDSGIEIRNYRMNRYIGGYDGIRKMLKSAGAKLKISFRNGFVELAAMPIMDYSQNEEFDSSQIDFVVERNYKPINHVICLGKGELAERQVVHLYADADGNISEVQTFFGLDEITTTYENANAESLEELRQGGIDVLSDAKNADTLEIDLHSANVYDIGDIVGARENETGIFVAKPISKKIVTIKKNKVTIEYEVGG